MPELRCGALGAQFARHKSALSSKTGRRGKGHFAIGIAAAA
jgi:hypothetical protein